MNDYDVDLFTIGAGSGGVRACRFAAQFGARVAVAESGDLGGTCVNVGCVPKKLLSYAAHFHEDFEDAAGYGWSIGQSSFDWPTLIAAKNREIARLNGIYERVLTASGVEIIHGNARIRDAHTVEVSGRCMSARHILVATGGWPTLPDIPGVEHVITSNEAFHLPELPRRVVMFGGGYIAVEFASIFNGLGAETTLVYRGERVVKDFDAELGVRLGEEMGKKGVRMRLGRTIVAVERAGDVRTVILDDGSRIEADCVFFATGRLPNTRGIGLEEAGVVMAANGAIVVDEHYQTSVPSIHAIGDATDRILLTPVALAEGMALADRLFNTGVRRVQYTNIATAIFSHPNIGTVGYSEAEARARHGNVKIYRSSFTALKHTLSGRVEKTFMKLVVDGETDRVLGVHMLGPDAGEVIQGFAIALNCGATKAQFDATIGIHPTVAEEFVTMREPS